MFTNIFSRLFILADFFLFWANLQKNMKQENEKPNIWALKDVSQQKT